MAKIFIEDSTLSAIGDSIRAKTGKTSMIPPLDMPTEIASIQTGGSSTPVSSNDVTFYDYDGTVVASYSLAEAQALTSLPAGTAHEGLTFQGWNWTLDKIKALTRPMNIGAMYITDDGTTRLHIRIATVGRMTVPLYIGQTVANGVSIDWGDGITSETLDGTGYVNTSHVYAEPGDYIISLMPDDGCELSFGSDSSSYCVIGSTEDNGAVYRNMLQEVSIGKNVTSIGGYAFCDCYSLASITIPDGVTSIGAGTFSNCNSLASITIPDGVTSIGYNVFSNCYSLASITIPDGVTSIGDNAFSSCMGMRYYDFSSSSTVPTLSNTNAFIDISSDCQILIPAALYDKWSSANNWSTYASNMIAV